MQCLRIAIFPVTLLAFTAFRVAIVRTAEPAKLAPPPQLCPAERTSLEAIAKRLAERIQRLDKEGKLTEAAGFGEEKLTADRKLFGDVHEDVVTDLIWLADRYDKLENFPAAKKRRDFVVQIQTERFGKHDWRVTDARWARHYTDLLAYFTPAKRRELHTADDRHLEVSRLYAEAKYSEAIQAARETAELRRAVLGETHPHYAESLNNLALLHQLTADYANAAPMYRQALKVFKESVGTAHPQYAGCLGNYATLLETQGDYIQAESVHREAIDVKRRALGAGHHDYAVSLNNLALLYATLGDYSRAEPLYREALAIDKSALGATHPDYAINLNNLALLYQAIGNYSLAEKYIGEALEITKLALGENQSYTRKLWMS